MKDMTPGTLYSVPLGESGIKIVLGDYRAGTESYVLRDGILVLNDDGQIFHKAQRIMHRVRLWEQQ